MSHLLNHATTEYVHHCLLSPPSQSVAKHLYVPNQEIRLRRAWKLLLALENIKFKCGSLAWRWPFVASLFLLGHLELQVLTGNNLPVFDFFPHTGASGTFWTQLDGYILVLNSAYSRWEEPRLLFGVVVVVVVVSVGGWLWVEVMIEKPLVTTG